MLLQNTSSLCLAVRRFVQGTMLTKLPIYVLVTPARDEAAYIEETIKSVVAQTILPLRWVIVSDGSTDGTDEVVRKFAAEQKIPEEQALEVGLEQEPKNFKESGAEIFMNV